MTFTPTHQVSCGSPFREITAGATLIAGFYLSLDFYGQYDGFVRQGFEFLGLFDELFDCFEGEVYLLADPLLFFLC